jgi:hypothetical protein
MKFMLSAFRVLLALVIVGAVGQQLIHAQHVGETRTGTFTWNGAGWVPVEEAQPVAAVGESVVVETAPPALPVYVVPDCPTPGLIWTPGHWRWSGFGYYWVPGVWVPSPYVGALWTPAYWGWADGRYAYHGGYWGPHIGFYGGVNYGGGYMGIGFAGGSWNGGVFAYNTAVYHGGNFGGNSYSNTTIVQQTTIINNNNVSYNGGPNGVQHQATNEEKQAEHETHQEPTKFQQQHAATAQSDKSNFASNNGGKPAHLAEPKPLAEEKHAPPAGFKPPPPKPLSELAKQHASPEVAAAAHTATTKTQAVAKTAPKPSEPTKPEPKAATTPKAEPKPAPKAEPKPAPKAEPKPAPKAEPKPAPKAEPKPAPKAETKPAPKTEPKPEPKPKK